MPGSGMATPTPSALRIRPTRPHFVADVPSGTSVTFNSLAVGHSVDILVSAATAFVVQNASVSAIVELARRRVLCRECDVNPDLLLLTWNIRTQPSLAAHSFEWRGEGNTSSCDAGRGEETARHCAGSPTASRTRPSPQPRRHGASAIGDLGFIGLDTTPDDPVASPASKPLATGRSPAPRRRRTRCSPPSGRPASTASRTCGLAMWGRMAAVRGAGRHYPVRQRRWDGDNGDPQGVQRGLERVLGTPSKGVRHDCSVTPHRGRGDDPQWSPSAWTLSSK